MARIKNSMFPNIHGDGHEKIITMDDGNEYVLKNSMFPNIHGDGYEQELIKIKSGSHKNLENLSPRELASLKAEELGAKRGEMIGSLLVGIGALVTMGILWLIAENFHIFL